MAFKDEERKSSVISVSKIMREVSDEKFENLIEKIKSLSVEERIQAARNNINAINEQFVFIWDENPMAWLKPFMLFVNFATQIACGGLESITEERKRQVSSYFQDVSSLQKIFAGDDRPYDINNLGDAQYQMLVEPFLTASLEPFTSDYPNLLFTYMLLVACADSVNEKGIIAIRKLREDYIDYADLKKNGKAEEFTGSLDRSIFLSPEQLKKAEEAARLAKEKEEAERQARIEEERKKKEEEERKQYEYEVAMMEYESNHSEWVRQCNYIRAKREDYVDEMAAKAKKEFETSINKEYDASLSEVKARKAECERIKAEAESTLASLGLFKINEKKRNQGTIESMRRALFDIEVEISNIQAKYNKKKTEVEGYVYIKKSEARNAAETEYPLPEEPKRPKR